MNHSPNRRYLTDWVKGRLSEGGIISGIIDAPLEGGWSDDPRTPGAYYEPYTVIAPLMASAQEGTLADPGLIWEVPYSLTSYTIGADSIEDQADTVRRILCEASRVVVDLGGVNWKVIGTMVNSIGAVNTNRQIEPPVLSQQDTMTVRISKA